MTQSTMAKHDRAIELRDLALAVVKARGEPGAIQTWLHNPAL